MAQIEHFNSQATTILLASLSREEYNKVQGLKSAKEIWDVLKTAHEGDELTKITKRETIEGEASTRSRGFTFFIPSAVAIKCKS